VERSTGRAFTSQDTRTYEFVSYWLDGDELQHLLTSRDDGSSRFDNPTEFARSAISTGHGRGAPLLLAGSLVVAQIGDGGVPVQGACRDSSYL
jgi:hypothetical protein